MHKEFPLRFVPPDTDAADWTQLEPIFAALEGRETPDVETLHRWVEDVGELLNFVQDERARRHVAYTQDTCDAQAEKRHMHFVREIDPKVKPCLDRLKPGIRPIVRPVAREEPT